MASKENNDETTSEKGKKTKRLLPQWLSMPLVVAITCIIIILFVQDNNYFKSKENQEQINNLKVEIKENLDSAEYYARKSRELDTDPEQLEKVSREQYNMKRPNEDVFITYLK
ncbi:MAG: septum formation initiator family protein [Muribaculaceae bacterium]|nr:septum formation initiator family protein [Muribaculaceae bacterium]